MQWRRVVLIISALHWQLTRRGTRAKWRMMAAHTAIAMVCGADVRMAQRPQRPLRCERVFTYNKPAAGLCARGYLDGLCGTAVLPIEIEAGNAPHHRTPSANPRSRVPARVSSQRGPYMRTARYLKHVVGVTKAGQCEEAPKHRCSHVATT